MDSKKHILFVLCYFAVAIVAMVVIAILMK